MQLSATAFAASLPNARPRRRFPATASISAGVVTSSNDIRTDPSEGVVEVDALFERQRLHDGGSASTSSVSKNSFDASL